MFGFGLGLGLESRFRVILWCSYIHRGVHSYHSLQVRVKARDKNPLFPKVHCFVYKVNQCTYCGKQL